jgi:putative tricarboxylic transport membrane protein
MRKHDITSGIFWFFFSVYVIYAGYQLNIGSLSNPGPGLILFVCGMGVCITSIVIVFQAFFADKTKVNIFADVCWQKPLTIVLIIFLYIIFFKRLGFVVDTTLLMIVLFKAVEPLPWKTTFLYSSIVVFVAWLVFAHWLAVPLPEGILEAFGI